MEDSLQQWVQTWQRAGVALDVEKRRELTGEQYYENHFPGLNAMLHYSYEHRELRTTTGLVEWQKTIKKIYLKNNAE